MKNQKFIPLLCLSLIFLTITGCDVEEDVKQPEITNEAGAAAVSDCGCDHIVDGYHNNGKELGIKPGDVICLEGNRNYNRLLFQYIKGTASNPVIIKNCGGVATITSKTAFGIKFEHSKHFILTGSGNNRDKYGIKISTDNGFYLSMERFTTNFEISRVEIAGTKPNGIGKNAGFAGIGVKTSPYQDCKLFSDPTKSGWLMEDIKIKNNYIHDVGGEGIYIGHGFYDGRKESRCSMKTYAHNIHNVEVEYNIIEDIGQDGLQIKNCDKDVRVHDNVIRNYGTRNKRGHTEGLFIGEGSVGDYYNNYIEYGKGSGFRVQGLGNLNIYNNVIINSGVSGIFASKGPARRLDDGYFNFVNNTICGANDKGFKFYGNRGGYKTFVNNIVVNTRGFFDGDDDVIFDSNLYSKKISSAGFKNYASRNFRIKSSSKARNTGYDLRPYNLFDDFDGNVRAWDGKFDIGAFEYR